MSEDLKQNLQNSINNVNSKSNRIYFFLQDTKGNAKASIRVIYDIAQVLKDNGYNVVMLYEKKDYMDVNSWMYKKHKDLNFSILEGNNLQVAPDDILIIPEIFGFVMDQVKNLPCGKIVLCQAYDHILETLQPGQSWGQLGFLKCITTSEQQKDYIMGLMKNVSVDVIEPFISNRFQKQALPANPVIAVHSREQRESLNIIKHFYLKFPQYRWVTFRDMRSMSESEFANVLCLYGLTKQVHMELSHWNQ